MGRREYGQPCSLACALDSIGERWALLIVRELSLGPLRFSDLDRAVGGAPTDVLTKRLRDLEADDIVEKRELVHPAPAVVYELTEFGRGLERPMMELARWGLGLQKVEEFADLAPSSLASGLRIILRPPADFELTLSLCSGGEAFGLHFASGWIAASRGVPTQPDLTLAGTPLEVIGALLAGDATALGVEVEGDRDALDRLREMVEIPAGLRGEALELLATAGTR
ncbi:MAG: winged helix-turn-helix transcriptional regulator [Solirubrobacterales bacterium]